MPGSYVIEDSVAGRARWKLRQLFEVARHVGGWGETEENPALVGSYVHVGVSNALRHEKKRPRWCDNSLRSDLNLNWPSRTYSVSAQSWWTCSGGPEPGGAACSKASRSFPVWSPSAFMRVAAPAAPLTARPSPGWITTQPSEVLMSDS